MSRRAGRRHSRRTEQRIRRHIDQRFADVVRMVARMIEATVVDEPRVWTYRPRRRDGIAQFTIEPLDDLPADEIQRRLG